MAFSINTLTAAGLEVTAGATATNRAVYTRVLSSEQAFTAEEARDAEVQDFEGPAGDIVAASAIDNVARIVGSVRNTSSTQKTLKSFALCGRLESGSERVVAVLSDEAAAVILPASGGPASAASVAFSFAFAVGSVGMVEITSAGSASVADLSRFVSLRSAGDASVGDAQTVLGEKRFADETTFDTRIALADGAEFYMEDSGFVINNGSAGIKEGQSSVLTGFDVEAGTYPDKSSARLFSRNASIAISSNGTLPGCSLSVTMAARTPLAIAYNSDISEFVTSVTGLAGLHPRVDPAGSVTIPVGGIVAAWVARIGATVSLDPGDTLDVGTDDIFVASCDRGTWSGGDYYLSPGSYVTLSQAYAYSGSGTVVFLMRKG